LFIAETAGEPLASGYRQAPPSWFKLIGKIAAAQKIGAFVTDLAIATVEELP
jgi:hypothetical protein